MDTIQANYRIRTDLKRWLDVEAAKRGLRPARVFEEMIELMREHTKDSETGGRDAS